MNTAKELMLGYINGTAEQSGALFADDGTLELPYLASIGVPPVMTGPRAITDFLGFLHGALYPGFRFEDVSIHIELRTRFLLNITSTISRVFRGKTSNSSSSVTWVSADGKIKRLREAIDVVVVAEAIYPNGLADVIKNKSPGPSR